MASLETLPAPLPFYILCYAQDLLTLDAARRSCSVFAAVWSKYGAELFERAIERTVAPAISIEIRFYLALLVKGPNIPLTEADMQKLYESRNVRRALPRNTPTAAMSRTLREHSYLASACEAILCSKLRRLQSLPHEHLENKSFSYYRIAEYQTEPRGQPYSLPNLSRPSWSEHQRILCAAWRLNIRQLVGQPAYLPALTTWQKDELEEFACSLVSLQTTEESIDHNKPISWASLAEPPLAQAEASPCDIAWRDTFEYARETVSRRENAYNFFHARSHRLKSSPLWDAEWKTFRRLGLGFWSQRRMAEELELLQYPAAVKPPIQGRYYEFGIDDRLSRDDLLFTWKALYLAETAASDGIQGND